MNAALTLRAGKGASEREGLGVQGLSEACVTDSGPDADKAPDLLPVRVKKTSTHEYKTALDGKTRPDRATGWGGLRVNGRSSYMTM